MPIQTNCPHCNKEYNLAETMAGKKVRCKACSELFDVEEQEPVEDSLESRPPKSNGSIKAKKPVDMESIPEVIAVDDEDGPNKKKKKGPKRKSSSGMLWVLLAGGAVLFLMLLCGGGAGAFFLFSGGGGGLGGGGVLAGGVSLENYNKIAVDMTEAQVAGILGRPTRIESPEKGSAGYDQVQVWEKGMDRINVRFAKGKVVILDSFINGQIYIGNDNRQGSPSNPNPVQKSTTKLTKANYDKIKLGKTVQVEVVSMLGLPQETKQQNVGPNGSQTVQTWREGDASITIISDSKNQIVNSKNGQNLR